MDRRYSATVARLTLASDQSLTVAFSSKHLVRVLCIPREAMSDILHLAPLRQA